MTRDEYKARRTEKEAIVKAWQEEQDMTTLEKTIKIGNDTIEIWRHGVDDYSADCTVDGVLSETEGWSVRGTLMDVMKELHEIYFEIFEN